MVDLVHVLSFINFIEKRLQTFALVNGVLKMIILMNKLHLPSTG